MKLPTHFAVPALVLCAIVSTLAPLAAHAQSATMPSQTEDGNYPLWSMQYDSMYFTVLSTAPGTRGAVTCTDSSVLGNIGSSGVRPAVVETRCAVHGHVVAPVSPAILAQANTQYEVISRRTCQKTLAGTLAGVTLAPGVYCFPAAAALTGTVTLNGPATGVWVIKVNGNLTGNSFSMVMAGKGNPCNVYIQSTGATTMTTSNAKGNMLAGEAITLTGGTFVGRAFAKKAVTLTDLAATGCVQ